MGVDAAALKTIEKIPFLARQFFKTNIITTTQFKPAVIFESSGTTGENTSRHYVKNLSFIKKALRRVLIYFMVNPVTGAYWHCCPVILKDKIHRW